jgi:hypothetical protein
MINYDDLDDMYDNLPTYEKVQRNSDPQGSLTEHRRGVTPNRNGAHKRNIEMQRRMKYYGQMMD